MRPRSTGWEEHKRRFGCSSKPGRAHSPKVAGSNPAPATTNDEGLADATAANPFVYLDFTQVLARLRDSKLSTCLHCNDPLGSSGLVRLKPSSRKPRRAPPEWPKGPVHIAFAAEARTCR